MQFWFCCPEQSTARLPARQGGSGRLRDLRKKIPVASAPRSPPPSRGDPATSPALAARRCPLTVAVPAGRPAPLCQSGGGGGGGEKAEASPRLAGRVCCRDGERLIRRLSPPALTPPAGRVAEEQPAARDPPQGPSSVPIRRRAGASGDKRRRVGGGPSGGRLWMGLGEASGQERGGRS